MLAVSHLYIAQESAREDPFTKRAGTHHTGLVVRILFEELARGLQVVSLDDQHEACQLRLTRERELLVLGQDAAAVFCCAGESQHARARGQRPLLTDCAFFATGLEPRYVLGEVGLALRGDVAGGALGCPDVVYDLNIAIRHCC